jgi:hypothetical protein
MCASNFTLYTDVQAYRDGLARQARSEFANDPQQSWGFEGEPPKAVMKDSGILR